VSWFIVLGALIVAGLIAWIGYSWYVQRTTPVLSYQVIKQLEGYEIRSYGAMTVAQIGLEGASSGIRDEAFGVLRDYLNGANLKQPIEITTIRGETKETSTRIAMTSPVLVEEGDERIVVSFVLPEQYTSQDAPRPTDPRVRILDIPEHKVAVRLASANAGDDDLVREREQLAQDLERDGRTPVSSFRVAWFGSPWVFPLMRSIEIHVAVWW
jgi:hypothetical protein